MIAALRPKTFTSAFEMQPVLSDTEVELLEELRKVKHESLWGDAIRSVAHARVLNVARFRDLVSSLKSQATDCPLIMQKIIGVDCYETLMGI